MSKLTRKQTEELRAALNHLQRGLRVLRSDNVVIGNYVPANDTRGTSRYTNIHGQTVELQSKTGADLDGLEFAIRHLTHFLNQHGFSEQRSRAPVVLHDWS